MRWFDSARTRLHLLFGRRATDSRANQEFRFHIEMETEQLMRAKGLPPDEARRQALAAFGGVEKHKEALRDGRGLAWFSSLSLDLKLGGRMLVKYPGLTLAGGLALAIALGIGAAWYDMMGKVLSPTIPLPEGDRIVFIETQNILTNEDEPRLLHDFLEWRRELRTVEDLGAYREDVRNLVADNAPPEVMQVTELTAVAFRTARVAPLRGRGLLDSDEAPGAPRVVVLGYEAWQRALGGRNDVIGLSVKLGNTPATVIGVMPEDFAYPYDSDAWTPLSLRASYGALEGGPIAVIGRLAPGATREQANAELRVIGERASAALPTTHANLRPRLLAALGELDGIISQFTMTNLPVLVVLLIACTTVGTLVYARTATREGEIALRSALGASRGRIIGQLFVESLVLAAVAAAVGLVAADRVLTWGIESARSEVGQVPFWMTPGLTLRTALYASGLAVVSAAMLSILPALRATRARVQSNLANLGNGGATLRFGRVWTGAMITQVALTAIGIPVAIEGANQVVRKVNVRPGFPSREHLTARIDFDRPFEEATPASEGQRARTLAALEQRLAKEPGVVAVAFAERSPASGGKNRFTEVEVVPGARPVEGRFLTSAVGPGFFETLACPIVAGRPFHVGDWNPGAQTVIVNEEFARRFARETGRGSPVGVRLRYPAPPDRPAATAAESSAAADASTGAWFEIVGVVRDFGLNPDDSGNEAPFVFHTRSVDAMSPIMMTVRVRGNPGSLAARLPGLAAGIDTGLSVRGSQALDAQVRERNNGLARLAAAGAVITGLVLFLSAMGIFSLVSVSVSRRTREIGLRAALGAHPRHVLAGVLSRAVVLMGSGIAAGGALLMLGIALHAGPTTPAEDIPLFSVYLAITSAVMLAACLLACIGPARRALRINPTDALREA
jgi:putative ABC transport system permease protein